jgi:hypothetical protein
VRNPNEAGVPKDSAGVRRVSVCVNAVNILCMNIAYILDLIVDCCFLSQQWGMNCKGYNPPRCPNFLPRRAAVRSVAMGCVGCSHRSRRGQGVVRAVFGVLGLLCFFRSFLFRTIVFGKA